MHGGGPCIAVGCAWRGAYMVEECMCGKGGHAWQGGHAWHTVNERAVRILLECILVVYQI